MSAIIRPAIAERAISLYIYVVPYLGLTGKDNCGVDICSYAAKTV